MEHFAEHEGLDEEHGGPEEEHEDSTWRRVLRYPPLPCLGLAWAKLVFLLSRACPGLAIKALHLLLAEVKGKALLGEDPGSQVPEWVHVIDVTRKLEK